MANVFLKCLTSRLDFPNMITWFADLPTPYFAPVLNDLSTDDRLDLRVIYLRESSDVHGWGDVELRHKHTFETRIGVRRFLAGYRQSWASDAIVVFGYLSFYSLGMLLAAKFRRRQVFTQSDTNIQDHDARPLAIRVLKRSYLRLIYPRSTRVWTVSDKNETFWRLQGLHNQCRIPFESPVPQQDDDPVSAVELKSSLNLTNRVILYVGRLAPEKRIQDAVQAVAILRDEGVDVSLLLVGIGKEDPRNDQNDAWLKLAGPVAHDQLAKYFLMADALVLPSAREPYGLVVREALQFGLPVVATDRVPCALELCDKGWNIVPSHEPTLLARALATACSSDRWPTQPVVDVAKVYRAELLGRGKIADGATTTRRVQ